VQAPPPASGPGALSSVMPAHSASEDARERAYVAGIHVFSAGTRRHVRNKPPLHDGGRPPPKRDPVAHLPWTVGTRFATGPGPFVGRHFRAHSSVGRAADS